MSDRDTMPKLVSMKEICAYLNVSENTMYKLIRKEEIPYVVIGHVYKFDMDDVKEYVKAQKRPARHSKKLEDAEEEK